MCEYYAKAATSVRGRWENGEGPVGGSVASRGVRTIEF